MEMHQLRYFVAVAQTSSFSRAAEACFVSQPSLSQQIAKVGSSRVDLQACKLEYSIVSPK